MVSGFGMGFHGVGFRVPGSGFRVSGLGFRVLGVGSQVSDFGVWGPMSLTSRTESRAGGAAFRDCGWEFEDLGFKF